MDRPIVWTASVAVLGLLAAASLAWAGWHAIAESADLIRRAEEVELLEQRVDPFQDRDLTYPPTALPMFAALVLPGALGTTRSLWLGLNLLALGVLIGSVVQLWGRDWPPGLKLAFGLAVAASKPVRLGIGLGQFHLIPVALMLLAVSELRRRRPLSAGVLVGVALGKPTMVLPFLGYLAIRRQWLALAAAAAWQALMLAAVATWLQIAPVRLMTEWLQNASSQESAGTIDVPSLVARTMPQVPVSATEWTIAVLLIGLAATWALRRRSELGLVSFTLFISAVFTYHRPYDLVLLVPALAYATDKAWRTRGRWATARAAVAIAFAVLLIWPSHTRIMGSYEEVYNIILIAFCYGILLVVIAYVWFDEEKYTWAEQTRRGEGEKSHRAEPACEPH
jgi:Glycosyltransferase family 87